MTPCLPAAIMSRIILDTRMLHKKGLYGVAPHSPAHVRGISSVRL